MNVNRICARVIVRLGLVLGLRIVSVMLVLTLLAAACSDSEEQTRPISELSSSDYQKRTAIPDRSEKAASPTAAASSITDKASSEVSLVNAVSPTAQEISDAGNKQSQNPPSTEIVASADGDNEKDKETEAQSESNTISVDVEPQVTYAPETGPLSLDERILRADIIARATLISNSTTTPQIFDGRVHKRRNQPATTTEHYMSTLELRFSAHEYLKGSGNGTLVVDIPLSFYDHYPSVEEAVEAATSWLIGRDSRWDNREALIFLQRPIGSESEPSPSRYMFSKHLFAHGRVHDDGSAYATSKRYIDTYSIRSEKNKSWLPATSASSSGASGASESSYFIEDPPSQSVGASSQGATPSITLSGMKSSIQAMGDLVKQGEGISGYRQCLIDKYELERELEHRGLTGPGPYYDRDLHTSSGLPAGSVINNGGILGGEGGSEYPRFFFTGPDMDLFWKEIEDNDNDSGSFRVVSKMRRPLPMGTYEVHTNDQRPTLFPCNYLPEPYLRWHVHVAAPEGTLHEAFFDPVMDTSASTVGAGATDGVLKPPSFTLDGVGDTTIERIEWASNSVKMELTPGGPQPADHHIDFIEMDGTVSLRLDFDTAATTTTAGGGSVLSWGVCEQPWQDGDQLMVRISESPSDLTDATNDPVCPPPAP